MWLHVTVMSYDCVGLNEWITFMRNLQNVAFLQLIKNVGLGNIIF